MIQPLRIESLYLQRIFKSIIQFHNSRLVATTIAVVWRTEDGDNILVMAPVVSLQERKRKRKKISLSGESLAGAALQLVTVSYLHDQLVGTRDQG